MNDRAVINLPAARTSLALVLPTLVGGGAERVGTELANHWVAQNRQVSLITIDADGADHPIDPRIRCVRLDLMRVSRSMASALWNNLQRVRRLRQAIVESAAQCVISFTDITNITVLLACRGLPVKVIVCERTDPRSHQIGRVWSSLRKRAYGRAHAIVVQTDAVGEWARSQGWNVPVVKIPNAVPAGFADVATAAVHSSSASPAIVALGRLSHEKGMDLLIRAFAEIATRHPAWVLRILGVGPERPMLANMAEQLGLASRIHLEGWTSDPAAVLRTADVFALPSRYEGFPNALLEAMSVGLPSVSFNCPSGPSEIIRSGIDGILVPAADSSAMARALDQLLSDSELRRRLGTAARDVAQRFGRDAFHQQWEAVLKNCGCVGVA